MPAKKSKKPVSKTTKRKVIKKTKPKTVVTKKTGLTSQRDQFFQDHPNARVLLGFFIVSVAILLGILFYTYRLHVEIGNYLWETEGILYNPEM